MANGTAMYVVKRDGSRMPVSFDEVTKRIRDLCGETADGLIAPLRTDASRVAQQVIARITNGMSTRDIDGILVGYCRDNASVEPELLRLAARTLVSDLHKRVPADPLAATELIIKSAPASAPARFHPRYVRVLRENHAAIMAWFRPNRDYLFDYAGMEVLLRQYLLRAGRRSNKSVFDDPVLRERPGHALLRIALSLFTSVHRHTQSDWTDGIEAALTYYDDLSMLRVSHASPMWLNLGTNDPQPASCFMLNVDDSMVGWTQAMQDAIAISKAGGGVSLCVSHVRAEGDVIASTGGTSQGIVALLRMLDEDCGSVNQGGVRPGAFAANVACWHPDLLASWRLARTLDTVPGENTPRLKYALWGCDEFFERLIRAFERTSGGNSGPEVMWPMFSPLEFPDLHNLHGPELSARLCALEAAGRARRTVPILDIFRDLHKTLAEGGTVYIMNGDRANERVDSVRLGGGAVEMTNICTEILLPTVPSGHTYPHDMMDRNAVSLSTGTYSGYSAQNKHDGMHGVCNLAAVCLPAFVRRDRAAQEPFTAATVAACIDLPLLRDAAGRALRAIDASIDIGRYPTDECARGNFEMRPCGLGIMGLAQVFISLRVPWGSKDALRLERVLMGTIYFGAVRESVRMAKSHGAYPMSVKLHAAWCQAHPEQSPAHPEQSQSPAMYEIRPVKDERAGRLPPNWREWLQTWTDGAVTAVEWRAVEHDAARFGSRNLHQTALMPTATTRLIRGISECFEPFSSNMGLQSMVAGNLPSVNWQLLTDADAGGWGGPDLLRHMLTHNGSIAEYARAPADARALYRVAFEIPYEHIMQHAAMRDSFVSQSQSLNSFNAQLSAERLANLITTGHRLGLCTIQYYPHCMAAASSQSAVVNTAAVVQSVVPQSVVPQSVMPDEPGCANGACSL